MKKVWMTLIALGILGMGSLGAAPALYYEDGSVLLKATDVKLLIGMHHYVNPSFVTETCLGESMVQERFALLRAECRQRDCGHAGTDVQYFGVWVLDNAPRDYQVLTWSWKEEAGKTISIAILPLTAGDGAGDLVVTEKWQWQKRVTGQVIKTVKTRDYQFTYDGSPVRCDWYLFKSRESQTKETTFLR